MPTCKSEMHRTMPFWSPKGVAATAPEAYDLARLRLRHRAAAWARHWESQASCAEGCDGPYHFRYTIEELALHGRPAGRSYAIWIRARVHWAWDCVPKETEPPLPPEDMPPGEGGGALDGPKPAGIEAPDDRPCSVSLELDDQSRMVGTGVFDWEVNLHFTAEASNPSHDFKPGSCRILDVRLREGGGLGSLFPNAPGPLGKIIKAIDEGVSAGWDLRETRFGLDVQDGPGEAWISGRIVSQPGLVLSASQQLSIRVTVEARDNHGETRRRTWDIEPRY